ncbi:MAG TPA: phosphatase PAP2 family protein [Verrucomicrobiae bacterium]|jgi:undecaprenyl-diphosphatase
MNWLQSLDGAAFRFINSSLANGVCDWLMPFFAGGRWFYVVLAVIAALLCWKGGVRGRLFVLMAFLAFVLADVVLCGPVKHAIGRPRPFNTITDARVLVGRGVSGSMPSSHAANWGALAMVALIYYGRRARFMVPLAALVAFSRVYVGVHYPSDVLVGAILGAGAGASAVLLVNWAWQTLGRSWFPNLWTRLPSLARPELRAP